MAKYVFDRESGGFKPKRVSLRGVLLAIVRYSLAVLAAAAAFYLVFALAFSTEREQELERENRLLEAEYTALNERLGLVEGSVGHLQERDRAIYRDLFNTEAPNSLLSAQDSLRPSGAELEDMPETDLVWDAYALVKRMESAASEVSRFLTEIDTTFSSGSLVPTAIPSIVPITPFSPVQTGASVGKKVNPFYKTIRDHSGLDLMAPAGTPVRCSADGQVVQVVRSEKGMGNQVTVAHKGGFRTVYAHLADIRVSQGQNLRQGALIGTVGQSGTCFAPCLHYEVLRDGFVQDPVNYFFAELSPATYRELMTLALTTGQSMD